MKMEKTMFGNKRQEIIGWIEECKSLDSLQRIRTKLNKRIKSLQHIEPYNPLDDVDTKKRREIISELLTKEDTASSKKQKKK